MEVVRWDSEGREQAYFHQRGGNSRGVGDVVVRFRFNQSKRGHQPVFCWKLAERLPDPFARLATDRGVFARDAGEIFWKLGFAARMPEMVEGGVGGDAPRPGAKIAGRFESRSGPVDAPESFHGQILGDSTVTDDADNPGIDFLLVLPKKRFESFQVARRESLQQLHAPLSTLNYWPWRAVVTRCFCPIPGM